MNCCVCNYFISEMFSVKLIPKAKSWFMEATPGNNFLGVPVAPFSLWGHGVRIFLDETSRKHSFCRSSLMEAFRLNFMRLFTCMSRLNNVKNILSPQILGEISLAFSIHIIYVIVIYVGDDITCRYWLKHISFLSNIAGFLCGLLCSLDGDIFASKDKDIHSLLMLVSFTISWRYTKLVVECWFWNGSDFFFFFWLAAKLYIIFPHVPYSPDFLGHIFKDTWKSRILVLFCQVVHNLRLCVKDWFCNVIDLLYSLSFFTRLFTNFCSGSFLIGKWRSTWWVSRSFFRLLVCIHCGSWHPIWFHEFEFLNIPRWVIEKGSDIP